MIYFWIISYCRLWVQCDCSKNFFVADIYLRVQFICGIKDSGVKEQTLQSELVELHDIVKKVIALEASEIESCELSKLQPLNVP